MLPDRSLPRYLKDALESLVTPFAQLVWLVSLRDQYSGRYLHEGWTGMASPAELHRLLVGTHLEVFDRLVRLSLVSFAREVRIHFRTLSQDESRAVRLWLELEPYREMIPEGCPVVLREFFISQFRLALRLLARAPDWTYLRVPASSPAPQPARRSPLHCPN